MLSIILYGRNDHHGTNYHKRIAISLNCLAEMLRDQKDEIVFADYNTPDELPTIIDAIGDTLTAKAKSRLKVLRIRPHHLQPYRNKTNLPLLEPVARNAAIRRTHPENRWILSTNADMVFVPMDQNGSLTSIVEELDDGFYLLPRFELPENFWELSLERLNPQKTLSLLRTQKQFHIVTRRQGFLKFDNPGDFQLMLRSDIFRIGGFDERMLKGWHVDSNLCKRMSLLRGGVDSLENRLFAYHCNHTRQESILHRTAHTENDWNQFVCGVSTPFLEKKDWGLAGIEIEEVQFKSPIQASSVKRFDFFLDSRLYNVLTYSSQRILTFLVDHLYHLPKTTDIVYLGYNQELLHLLTAYLEKNSFLGKIRIAKDWIPSEHPMHKEFSFKDSSGTLIYFFDFGFDEDSPKSYEEGRKKLKKVRGAFLEAISYKKHLHPNAKFVGINALRTDFYPVFERYLSIRKNTYISGHIYGYIPERKEITSRMLKARIKNFAIYLVSRYFYNQTDRIIQFLTKKKLAKSLFKSDT